MSNSVTRTIQKFGLEQAFNYLYKDPDKNMLKIMDWADKFAGDQFVSQRKLIREAMTNPEHHIMYLSVMSSKTLIQM